MGRGRSLLSRMSAVQDVSRAGLSFTTKEIAGLRYTQTSNPEPGGRLLGSGRQLHPQLTVGRRPLGGGGGGGGGGLGGAVLGGAMGGGIWGPKLLNLGSKWTQKGIFEKTHFGSIFD